MHLLTLLVLLFPLARATYLWKIDVTPPSYLFGTIHFPYTLVWNAISDATKEAFDRADNFYVEVSKDTELSSCFLMPEGKKLDLDPEIAAQIPQELQNLRPEWIVLALSQSIYTSAFPDIPILDHFLEEEATLMGKRLGALETGKEMCEAINDSLDPVQARLAIYVFMAGVNIGSSGSMHKIVNDYRLGLNSSAKDDFRNLIEPIIKFSHPKTEEDIGSDQILDQIYTLYSKNLVTKRDTGMTKSILRKLRERTGESNFFAVGAAHLVGSSNTIVDRVRAAGYKVERVVEEEKGKVVEDMEKIDENEDMKEVLTALERDG